MATIDALVFAAFSLVLLSSAARADTLGEALDRPELTWTTGGDAPWRHQTAVTLDGVDAAQCGSLTAPSQISWLETTVTGRVCVAYWWKLSSAPNYYTFYTLTNGAWAGGGYGERDWQPEAISFAEGINTLKWTYNSPPIDPTNWNGNAAWLDRVLVTNIADLPPVFLTPPPATLTLPENSYHPTNLAALAIGDIPLTLQWQRNGTNLASSWPFYDVNSLALTIYPRTADETAGEFRLVASNRWGSATSAVCTVTMSPAPPSVPPQEPADRVVALGGYFNLWASVYGSPPFALQWYKDGTPVPTATNQYYVMNPAGPEHDGAYHFVVANAYGAATSRVAQVTTSIDPPTILSGPSPEFQERLPGETADFNIEASGPEWLFLSWRKVGESAELSSGNWLTLDALEPADSGLYNVVVNNSNGTITSRAAVLAVAPVTALAVAVNAPQLVVTNHNYAWNLWLPDTEPANAHDGFCAARSPSLGEFDSASFSATVTGPTDVAFRWRISAAPQAFLEVAVDGILAAAISGETSWQQQALILPAGEHTLTWTFRKEDAGSAGADAAWVDTLTLGGGTPGSGHTLVAHYPFDDSVFLGADASGNNHHIMSSSSWGLPEHQPSTDAVAGGGAVLFYGNSSLAPPTNVLAALQGSFTVAAWLKTWQTTGSDGDDGPSGAGVVWAGMGYLTDSTIPIALTGAKAAFWTGSPVEPFDVTLHSVSDVNTGDYVHIAVTRDQATGEKRLYVNGTAEGMAIGSTRPLTGAAELFDLAIGGGWTAYIGLLDDLQFYTGVLDPAEIAFLHQHPGETAPDSNVLTLGQAVNAPQFSWVTGGASDWFPQTSISQDGVAAAQSGPIGDSSETHLESVVNGPGALSFWWKVSCQPDADFLELWVDDVLTAWITGEQDWSEFTLDLAGGQHLLRWTYVKDASSADGADAAWLDQCRLAQPASARLNLEIVRETGGGSAERFLLFPQLDSVTPDLVTKHLVQSPNAFFEGAIGGEWSSSSRWMDTLESLIRECTNGVWTLYLNQGDPSEQRFTFAVSIHDLDSDRLGPVTVHNPAHGAANVPPNPPFTWTGPTNLPNLSVYFYSLDGGTSANASLPVTATNWPSPPALSSGTNRFSVSYYLWDAPHASCTVPVDANLVPIQSWTATASLRSSGSSTFAVGSPSAGALLHPQLTPGGFRFEFQSVTGQSHAIQASTALDTTAWQTLTNFLGDGTLWQFTFPIADSPTRFFRARTQ